MVLTATSANNAQAASATPRDKIMPRGNVPVPRIGMLALTRFTLTEIARSRFLGEKVRAKVLHTKQALHGKHMLLAH
jgi:hypothetical protein